MSEEIPRPNISPKLAAALSRPCKFFIGAPLGGVDDWVVVETGNPYQPLLHLYASEGEAWLAADELNNREIKQRAAELRDLQRDDAD
jgi:hypothetical protein